MQKFWLQLLGLVIVIFAATYITFNSQVIAPFTSTFSKKPATTVSVKNDQAPLTIVGPDGQAKAKLSVDIADDPQERSKGLGGRLTMATDSGMLFLHDKTQVYTYWMKDMHISLDMIWILDDQIVDIITNVPPPLPGQSDDTLERYAPTVAVNRVLETNAGYAAAHNIQKGDKIILERSP